MPDVLVPYAAIIFALIAAFLFAVGSQFQNLGLQSLDSRTGTALSITTSALYLWALAPFFLEPALFATTGFWVFVLIGCFRPAVSANLSVAAIRHLGPTLSSTLASTSPLFGTALGVLALGEVLTWQTALGTFGIVFAVALLSRRKKGDLKASWPIWALALPIGAAGLRSIGHALSKVGMLDAPDPYFAGLIAFTVSALVTIGISRLRKAATPIPWELSGPKWFMAAGICFGTAVTSLNYGLLIGDIVEVIPIIAASPIFTLALSILVFRKEKITRTIVLSVFIVVASVIGIALG